MVALTALAMSTSPLRAQPRPLAPVDLFALQYAGDPQISPDGQWIAYVRKWSDVTTDRRYSNISLVRADGTQGRTLTSGAFTETSPRWSPDGTRLLYVSNRGGKPQLYVHTMASRTDVALTNDDRAPSAPAWSADGRQVAFLALVPTAPLVIGQPLTPPAGATWAAPPKVTDRLTFRYDGLGELPRAFMHAFVVSANGGTVRQVTRGDFDHGGTNYAPGSLAWTPDGRELVMPARRDTNPELHQRETELYAVSVADGALRRLTRRYGPDASPVVSPDGQWIAFTGFDDTGASFTNTQLYVMRRDGSGRRSLTANADRNVDAPVWAADGQALYVRSDVEGNTRVLRVTLDGAITEVARDLGEGNSAYGGGSFSVSRGGVVAYSRSMPQEPSDVAVAASGAPARVVTALNAALLTERRLGAVEELWYTSSKDGLKIQGWLIKPPGFDPSRKYPLILEIHGGPFLNYGSRFDEEKQLMAAAGYLVLYVNPRGSTSYGESFAMRIHHTYPGDDRFDLESGVDAIIARGIVDTTNLFVTGGSGGGVLTAWLIGHTTRYRAAAAFYPVINWESFNLTADIAPNTSRTWFPGMPWDHVANYDQRSLLSVVKQVKTPTIIMTGEEDYRTPMSESEQYYKALKMLGVESVLVRVPEESHGIRKRPSHEASKVTTALGWFARYRYTP
ncbi:S9 family peptidase [Gemmatimonas sp.]|uniref:alpha/beta hydrolase family protein n=1 Tax=Gemmatimonas sp. TaxID=1962908 RepID=UPI0027B93AA3|nr:S9 family peptidase [Gemmatimonas sp.]